MTTLSERHEVLVGLFEEREIFMTGGTWHKELARRKLDVLLEKLSAIMVEEAIEYGTVTEV